MTTAEATSVPPKLVMTVPPVPKLGSRSPGAASATAGPPSATKRQRSNPRNGLTSREEASWRCMKRHLRRMMFKPGRERGRCDGRRRHSGRCYGELLEVKRCQLGSGDDPIG